MQIGELPETWGLMAIQGGKLKVIKDAPKLEPIEFSRLFLASILRQAQEQLNPESELLAYKRKGYEEGEKQAKHYAKHEIERLQKKVQDAEEALGCKLDPWNLRTVAEAARLVKGNKLTDYMDTINAIRRQALRVLEAIDKTEVKEV